MYKTIKLTRYIDNYLSSNSKYILSDLLKDVYKHLYISIRGELASAILEEELRKKGAKSLRLKLQTSLELIILNYFTDEEIDKFYMRLNLILNRVKIHIEAEPYNLSPTSVVTLLRKASAEMVYETLNAVKGTKYQGKNLSQLRDALGGFMNDTVAYVGAMYLIKEVADDEVFVLGETSSSLQQSINFKG